MRGQPPALKLAASKSFWCRIRSLRASARDSVLDSVRDSARELDREVREPMNEGRLPSALWLLWRCFVECMCRCPTSCLPSQQARTLTIPSMSRSTWSCISRLRSMVAALGSSKVFSSILLRLRNICFRWWDSRRDTALEWTANNTINGRLHSWSKFLDWNCGPRTSDPVKR